jgi:ClpP class serine protease
MLEVIASIAARQDLDRHAVASAAHWSEGRQREAARALETRIPMQAVGAYHSSPVADSYNLYRRGSVGILPIAGPITRYSNLFQMMSGQGTSVEALAKDFQLALDSPAISAVLLSVDSPGGETNGIAEFSDMVYAARGIKPVWAYVSDLGASAAYWIASAAERIVVAQTAAIGSIGCVAVFPDQGEDNSMAFVSSVSPRKRVDLSTKSGRADVQALVDTFGELFVGAVARNRGTTAERVVEDYGAGGLLIGEQAVEAGMVEAVGSFEATLAELEGLEPTAAPVDLKTAATLTEAYVAATASIIPVQSLTASSSVVPIEFVEDGTPSGSDSAPAEATAEAVQAPVEDPMTSPTPAVDSLAAEMATLKAENARLRYQNYQIAAEGFADKCVTEMRAFPGEKPALVEAYVQAAKDDESLGTDSGRPSRVQLLANLLSARPSVATLTAEALAPKTYEALSQRASGSSDPNQPMSEDRKLTLLGASPLGRTASKR